MPELLELWLHENKGLMKPTNQPTPPRGALSKLKSATEKEVHHDSETRGQQEQINTFVTVKFVIHKLMSFSKVFFWLEYLDFSTLLLWFKSFINIHTVKGSLPFSLCFLLLQKIPFTNTCIFSTCTTRLCMSRGHLHTTSTCPAVSSGLQWMCLLETQYVAALYVDFRAIHKSKPT